MRSNVLVWVCAVCLSAGALRAQTTNEQRPGRPVRQDGTVAAPNPSAGVTFADGTTQTTAATLTGVTAGSGLAGGGTSGNVPLAVDTTVARTTAANSFIGAQEINGNVLVTGTVQISGGGNSLKFPDGTTQTTAASGGGSSGILSGTVTVNQSTSIPSGGCITSGVTVTGATTSMVVVISPSGDPSTKGLNEVIWSAFVDASNHVTAQFCHFTKSLASASAAQVFNIRVIP